MEVLLLVTACICGLIGLGLIAITYGAQRDMERQVLPRHIRVRKEAGIAFLKTAGSLCLALGEYMAIVTIAWSILASH